MSTDHHSEEVKVSATVTMSRDDLIAAMNANTPKPLTTTQQSAAAGSKFARPDFDQQQAAVRPAGQPATEKQITFIRKLLAERVGITEAEDIRNALNQARTAKTLDRGMVSEFITRLLAIKPAPQAPQAPASAPVSGDAAWKRSNCVPDGNYALAGEDGVVKFYEVNTPEDGKFAGTCFVSVHASDERFNLKGRTRHQVLDALAADPIGAMRLYGYKSLRCGRCGRELSQVTSRATGYGSTCARKLDVHYATMEEALAILSEGNISLEGISDLPAGFTAKAGA